MSKQIKMGRLIPTLNTRRKGRASSEYLQTVLEMPPYDSRHEFGVMFTQAEINRARARFAVNQEDAAYRTAGQDSRD